MADQTTDTPLMTHEEAIKIIYLAKHTASAKTFTLFQKDLADEKIPWSFSDPRFLEKVQKLKIDLVAELNLQNELVSRAAEESFSRSLSEEEREGITRGFEQIQNQEQTHREDLFKHTESLVDSYVKQLKAQGALPPDQESGVRTSISQAAQKAANRGEFSDIPKQMALAAGDHVSIEAASSAASSLTISPEALEAANRIAHLSAVTQTALTAGEDIQTGGLIEKCLSNPDTDPTLIADKNSGELRAEKIFSLSEPVQTDIESALNDPQGNYANRRLAFEKAATSVGQGTSKPLRDVITTIGGPDGKNFISDVIETIMGPSIQEARTGTVGGVPFTKNPLTDAKIQQAEAYYTQKGALRRTPGRLLSGDMVELWRPQVQEGFRLYLESATIKTSARAPEYLHYFVLAGSDIWRTIVGGATKKAAREAVKAGAEKTAVSLGIKATGAAFGGPVGTAIVIAGEKALSFVWNGFLSFIRFGGDIAKGILGGINAPQAPKPWHKQDSWILAIVCVLALLFCTGFTFIRETATTAAIVAEKDKTGGATSDPYLNRGEPHGDPTADLRWNAIVEKEKNIQRKKQNPIDQCATSPAPLWCTPINCPTCVCFVLSSDPNITPTFTQLPGGSYTHANSNAIDVRLPMQSGIISPIEGVVTESVSEFEDGSGYAGSKDGGGYGNHVVVTDTKGNKLIFAHLAYTKTPPPLGSTVSIGQQVGRVGQTGYSTGPHLHIGYLNSGSNTPSIGSLFPASRIALGAPACDSPMQPQ